jgi:hypothetical protein
VLKNKKARGPPPVPSGLLANWDQEDDLLPAPSRSSASAPSRFSSVAVDDDLTTGVGGIPSDDDEIEHQELDTAKQSSFRFQVRHSCFFKNSILLPCSLVSRNG